MKEKVDEPEDLEGINCGDIFQVNTIQNELKNLLEHQEVGLYASSIEEELQKVNNLKEDSEVLFDSGSEQQEIYTWISRKRKEQKKIVIAARFPSLDYKKAEDHGDFNDEGQLGSCDKIEADGKIRTLTIVPMDLAEEVEINDTVESSDVGKEIEQGLEETKMED